MRALLLVLLLAGCANTSCGPWASVDVPAYAAAAKSHQLADEVKAHPPILGIHCED